MPAPLQAPEAALVASAFLEHMAAAFSPKKAGIDASRVTPMVFWDTPCLRVPSAHGLIDVARGSGRVVRFSGELRVAPLGKVKPGIPRAQALLARAAPDLSIASCDARVEEASGWVHFTLRPPEGAVSVSPARAAVRFLRGEVLEGFERTDLMHVRMAPVAVPLDRARALLAACARADKMKIEGDEEPVLEEVHIADDVWVTVWKAPATGRGGARGTVCIDADSGERCGPEERNARRAQRAAR
jgi:hypothetical protein